MRLRTAIAAATTALVPTIVSAQVSVDGHLGAEWAGITPTEVFYNAAAPESNFGSPTNGADVTGYKIYMRSDATWLYTALVTTDGRTSGGQLFANLYYSLRFGAGPVGTGGSSIGFEVTNDRAFSPGNPGYFNDNGSNEIQFATSSGAGDPDIIESAIKLSVFTNNDLGVAPYAPDASPVGIRLNLSQAFGYSVAGGQAAYGDTRLGYVPLSSTSTPEPATYVLVGSGLALLGIVKRKRANT